MVKFTTNACDATWLLILQTMQLVPTGGQIWNKCIRTKCETLPEAQRTQGIESIELELSFGLNWICTDFSFRVNSSFRLSALGPLCLWQCFLFNFFFSLQFLAEETVSRQGGEDASNFPVPSICLSSKQDSFENFISPIQLFLVVFRCISNSYSGQ